MAKFRDMELEVQKTLFEALTAYCYNASVHGGWHNDINTGARRDFDQSDRMVPVRISLIHSELSEGLEGHRKSLQDDKLPQHSMLAVELADAAIRIFDLAGCMELDLKDGLSVKMSLCYFLRTIDDKDMTPPDYIAVAHYYVSQAFFKWSERNYREFSYNLSFAVQVIIQAAERSNFALLDIMGEKMEFNLTRDDHKHANRKAVGGKAF